MKIYCLPLEIIAFAIHPGNTESTTTVCLDVSARCLYMTSQSNFDFSDVTTDTIHNIIDYLIEATAEHKKGNWSKKKCIDDFWLKHCALADVINRTSSNKVVENIDKIYGQLYTNLWNKFLDADYSKAVLLKLKSLIWQVAVIKDKDISYAKAIDKVGVHGESRIIRFLFIRDYPMIHLTKTSSFFYLLPGEELSKNVKDNARKWFREKISIEPFAMGSSQGTCLGCCECLEEFSIAHGDAGNKPKQWMDPLTLCGDQGGTELVRLDSHHAIYVAFKYLIPPKD